MDENMWSSLPVDMVWLIKDKLNVFDNSTVNCVCKGWSYASKFYPARQTYGVPWVWIMQYRLELTSITGMGKVTMVLPESLRGSDVVFSKQGWVLLHYKQKCGSNQMESHKFVLFHLWTLFTFNLPEYVVVLSSGENDKSTFDASFSIHNGCPIHVVLYIRRLKHHSILAVTRVGDEGWTEYTCPWRLLCGTVVGLQVIGQAIYCCHLYGQMITYNIGSQMWSLVVEQPEGTMNSPTHFYMEFDGQVLLYWNTHDGSGDRFYYYSDTDDVWKRLSDNFKNDKSMFVHQGPCTFISTREDSFKVYGLVDPLASWVDIG